MKCIDDFQIAGIRHDVTESLKSAVRYSNALGPRFFRWKILSLSGPKADGVDVNDFRVISLDTKLVSREEVCLPSFDMVYC